MSDKEHKNLPAWAKPLEFTDTPLSIKTDVIEYLERMDAKIEEIISAVKISDATFENVILPLVFIKHDYAQAIKRASFWKWASSDRELLEECEQQATALAERQRKRFSNKTFFDLVKAARDKRVLPQSAVQEESGLVLDSFYKRFLEYGIEIPDTDKKKFQEMDQECDKAIETFCANIKLEKGGIEIKSDRKLEENQGVLSEFFDSEKSKELQGTKGTVWIPNKQSEKLLTFATNADLRERMVRSKQNAHPENVKLFKEIIEYREDIAKMRGYENHAELVLDDMRLFKTPAQVRQFLEVLRRNLEPRAKEERNKLIEMKRKDLEEREKPNDGRLYLWDKLFYENMLRMQEMKLAKEEELQVRQFFPLKPTLDRILKQFEHLFRLVFVEVETNVDGCLGTSGPYAGKKIVWDPKVLIYSVWDDADDDCNFLGYMYFDLYQRDGKKNSAYCTVVQEGFDEDLYGRGIGRTKRNHRANALVMSLMEGSEENPTLLEYREVVTMFHEIGHGVHDMVSKAVHIGYVVSDFREVPSVMLEYWCSDASFIRAISGRSKDEEKISDDLAQKLTSAAEVNRAIKYLTQVQFALFDMDVHAPEGGDVRKISDTLPERWNEKLFEIRGFDGLEVRHDPTTEHSKWGWGHYYATITHLVSGYDGNMYKYLYGEVMGADMFKTRFAGHTANRDVGLEYRRKVLEPGWAADPVLCVDDFLGRKHNHNSFLESLASQQRR